MAARIVVVEDEPDIGTILEATLRQEGFGVTLARDGQSALDTFAAGLPDLVLLDLALPDMSGLDVLKALRRSAHNDAVRVIVLTAKAGELDRILGLELGADDYVTKPFSLRELVLRVRAVLQRGTPEVAPIEPAVLHAGPIRVDLDRHEAHVRGETLRLTLTEFRLLAELVRAAGRVRSRDRLLADVWGYDSEVLSRTVDTHVRRLRSKLGPASGWLDTVRGVGYRILDPGARNAS
jgi:two-component system, OmpR family, phosphate regulon response regulator PhoB